MNKFKKLFIFLSVLVSANSNAQSFSINTDGTAANPSAILDVKSNSKGFLPPRMTTLQRDAITSPAAGLVLFNSTINNIQFYTGSGWVSLTTPSTTAVFLPTIVIGTQQWMSKNLDVAFYRNGDPIPHVTDTVAWSLLTTGAWCYYNNDSTQGGKYGKLYNWYAVNDPRGLAPIGWHVSSDAELNTLESTLGGIAVAGGKMKEAGTLNWASPNTGGNNNSGFAALPGGRRVSGGFSGGVGGGGDWWSSTEVDPAGAWGHSLSFNLGNSNRGPVLKLNGLSVRCIRD
jgi:uncharacterized protein (TIGR02145 family)